MKNDFHIFVRDDFGGVLSGRGYRRKGGAFERSEHGVRVIAGFFRYNGALRPMFNIRLQVVLDAYVDELGVILSQDLSNMIGRGSHVPQWRWPLSADARQNVSREIAEALTSTGLPWLESLLGPRELAARLESDNRFTPESDAAFLEGMAHLEASGVKVAYQSDGFLAPRAGKLKPNRVRALSYCYELAQDWRLALRAWDEYASTFTIALAPDHPAATSLRERKAFLEAKCQDAL